MLIFYPLGFYIRQMSDAPLLSVTCRGSGLPLTAYSIVYMGIQEEELKSDTNWTLIASLSFVGQCN